MQLQFIKVGPNGNKIEGVRGSGGCGILPVAMKLSDFLTVLVAGVVAGYKYCRTVIGEADVSSERIFADSTDAGLIKEVLSSGASTQEWDTALHQLTMGLRVTAQLNEHEIATLRDAVQDAEKILNKHDRALKMLARALWKNRGKDSEAYASISKEEIDAIWVKERQV
jgi:hypothetical protein